MRPRGSTSTPAPVSERASSSITARGWSLGKRGKNCRLYQGVTLGALSFRKDASGVLIKGLPRHPHLGDGVTIYAGATVLGNITIGSGAIIGANMWVTEDVPERARIVSGNK